MWWCAESESRAVQVAREAHYIIHGGVIDILQSYGVRKQTEAMVRQ